MPILYSAIGKGSTVLCFYQQSSDSSYDVLASNILPNLSSVANAKTSYTTNNNVVINVLVESGLVFMCASSPDINKAASFEFLTEVKNKFLSSNLLERAQYAVENELNRDFGPVLANLMEKYSNPSTYQSNSQLSSVQAQVDEVKGVMTRNIEAVLQRGQRLEDLLETTNSLEASASTFQKTARRVKQKMWWKNTKMIIACALIALIVLVVIIIIILFSTGVLPVQTDKSATTTTTTTTTTKVPVNGTL